MGKDMELLKAVKEEDIPQVQRIMTKLKAKQKKQGTIKKSPVNYQDEDGFSALHHAALISNCNIMAALLDCNQISVDIKDNKGMRPLHYAAWQGKVEPVNLLVKFGSAPNDGSQDGETPLHLAAQYGSHMVVDTLLRHQADPTLKNKAGKTALDLAAEFGRLKVVQLLMNSNQSTALLDIPSRTRVSMHTPLHLAAKNGHSDVIRVLLEYGIDINRETPNGTALHEAALAGKSEVVKLLIASGIDVYKKNSHGQTALDIVNKFTPTRAAQDIKQLLRDSIGGSQARALQDYVRIHDRSALSFKAGDIISVLERNPDGKWKGSISKGNIESIGFFPSSHVELLTRPVSTSSIGQQSTFSYASTSPTSTGLPLPTGQSYPHGSTPLSNSVDPMHGQPFKHGYYHPPSSNAAFSPPQPPPLQPMNGSIPYGMPQDKPFPPATDHYHSNMVGSPPRAMAGSPHHIPSPTHDQSYYHAMTPQHPLSPRRLHPDGVQQHENGIWLKQGGGGQANLDNSGEESGVDVSSSTESMEKRSYGGIRTPGNAPTIHMNVSTKPLAYSQPFRSFENVLGDKDTLRSLAGNQRPHSDGSSDIKMEIMRHPDVKPQYKGKDADRIYEWLKRQGMPEYTNNFTKAGYDMPTISRMTPEDLTAIGVTKPGHRKRISAMISQLSEPDGIPNYKPTDVVTWLKLLDLYQYYNTFVSNNYNTMDAVSEITWEDLQEMGINQLGHQKKFSLAIKRLRDLQKQATKVLASAQQAGSAGSDNDSVSPHSSSDGAYHHYPHPNALMLAQLGQRTSPLQSPDSTLAKKKPPGLRSSQESLGSDGSNKSSGSQGSHEQAYPKKIVHLSQLSENREASYIPTSLKVTAGMQPEHKAPTPEGDKAPNPSAVQTFSTFKQPPVTTTPGETFKIPAVPRDRKSNDSLERVLLAQGSGYDSSSGVPKRNSVEGGSSIGSSGSGDGSVKMKRSNPPAPPKRTNSIRTVDEEQLKTATIGRKKSLKQFREEMAAGNMNKKVELPEGYATIKRSGTRKTQMLTRSASQEGDFPPLGSGVAIGPPVPPTVPALTQGSIGNSVASGVAVTSSAPSQPNHSMFSSSKVIDETPAQTVNYSAYGVTNQPVLTPVHQQQQPSLTYGPYSQTSTPSRSASVPTSPVTMQQPTWTNQQTPYSRDLGTPSVSASVPSSASSTPSHNPTVSKPNAALIAEMQQSIAACMPPSARLNPQSSVKSAPESSFHVPSATTSDTQQSAAVPIQLPPSKADDKASTQRQPSGLSDDSQSQSSAGGTFKIPQGLPPRMASNRPASGELLLNTSRRPSSGGFKLGVDIEQEKQTQSRAQQAEVNMREGGLSSSQRPPSTGSTGSGGSGSTDSGSGKSDRPGNMELLWKRMSQEGEENAPIIQPALSKPLEGIWRPKSRHYDIGSQLEDQNQVDFSTDGESSNLKIQTKATFRSLKKQFLDQNSTPITYHTLKRPPKKPDPNFSEEDFRPRSKSFTDMDEYNQSPVAKDAPVNFETYAAKEDAIRQPDFDTNVESLPPGSDSFPTSGNSFQNMQTQNSSVKMPFPDNGGHAQKPVSLPGLVSNYGAKNLGSDKGSFHEPVLNSQPHPPSVGPKKVPPPQVPPPLVPPPQVPPPQVPPPKIPKPQSLPPQASPPPPQAPQPQASPPKAPSSEEPFSKAPPQKVSPQQVLPPKVSPKAPRMKAAIQPPPPPAQQEMMPPPPPVDDLPPPPPNDDFPLPPPPSQEFDLPPPPLPEEAGLPPPPPLQTNTPPYPPFSCNNFPAPPPTVQPVSQKLSRQAGGPQTAPKSKSSSGKKKSSHRTPVVSEGWESNSDTIKRKPSTPSPGLSLPPDNVSEATATSAQSIEPQQSPSVDKKSKKSPVKAPVKVPEKSVKSPSRTGKAAVKAPVKKKAVVAPPPLEDSDDVDFYSQDLDMMDTLGGQDAAVESDSSDTMESALSGFENENTDTIKKQPMKLSPARAKTEVSHPETLGRAPFIGESASAGSKTDVMRDRDEAASSKKKRDSQGFGEVSLQLADILNSMGSEDPLANFAANAEASAKARLSPTKSFSPTQTGPLAIQEPASQEPVDSKDIFNDIESMFNDLTFDLDSMMN
ncbi:uncharacterized protein LOC110981774 isoform X3 [Acanthaster planci]|uniref:Uncharacterized protein LOC110981774 isoform X3 n=1 Tax=Acanthaster planci TaxID=133434 RepID=A0A8B7YPY8_ACAPL|nr:uncharacterized protein LOC110981774 isoform X3 [Acanthaster planci]